MPSPTGPLSKPHCDQFLASHGAVIVKRALRPDAMLVIWATHCSALGESVGPR